MTGGGGGGKSPNWVGGFGGLGLFLGGYAFQNYLTKAETNTSERRRVASRIRYSAGGGNEVVGKPSNPGNKGRDSREKKRGLTLFSTAQCSLIRGTETTGKP